jgi:ribosomal protein S18 acetylase RimI-like enzyme
MTVTIDPLAAIERLNVEYTQFAIAAEGWDGVVADDVLYLTAGVPIAELNLVAAARFHDENADARIDAVVRWFADRDLPVGWWWVSPRDTPADLPVRLRARGFGDEEPVPGMLADLDTVGPERLPDAVTIERADDADTYRIACQTMAEGFGATSELGRAFEAFAPFNIGDAAPSHMFLARLDGEPVATSLGLVVDEVVGIFNVATVERARRRGIGRAVTLAAMLDGAERGARNAVLQSSSLGRPVYESLGFRDFATYRLLILPPH